MNFREGEVTGRRIEEVSWDVAKSLFPDPGRSLCED